MNNQTEVMVQQIRQHPNVVLGYDTLNIKLKEPIPKTGQIEALSDTMHPKISKGDQLFIRQMSNWREILMWGEIYVVKINDVVLTTRLCKGKDDQHLLSVPDNNLYEQQELPVAKIKAVFRVVGIFKRIAM